MGIKGLHGLLKKHSIPEPITDETVLRHLIEGLLQVRDKRDTKPSNVNVESVLIMLHHGALESSKASFEIPLNSTADLVLEVGGHAEGVNLIGYSDSDFAGCVDTRRSTSGYGGDRHVTIYIRASCSGETDSETVDLDNVVETDSLVSQEESEEPLVTPTDPDMNRAPVGDEETTVEITCTTNIRPETPSQMSKVLKTFGSRVKEVFK